MLKCPLLAHLVGTTVLGAPALVPAGHDMTMRVGMEPPSLGCGLVVPTLPGPTTDAGTGSGPALQQ